ALSGALVCNPPGSLCHDHRNHDHSGCLGTMHMPASQSASLSSIHDDRFLTRNYKFVVLVALYIAQAIPSSFFDTVLPVVLRQKGLDLDHIGLLKLATIPAALK